MNQQRYIIKTKEIRDRAANAVAHIRGDDDMEVIIQKRKKDKTAEQRGFWHLLCREYSRLTPQGWTEGQVKAIVKAYVFGIDEIERNGKIIPCVKSSEDGSVKREDYSRLIEATYEIAAEDGIVLPNPYYKE